METALPQSGHFLRKHIDSYLRVSEPALSPLYYYLHFMAIRYL